MPPDLAAAVQSYAEASGITPSEVLRSAVYQLVYNAPPGAEEGYAVARSMAVKLAHAAIDVGAAELPQTMEELPEFLSRATALHNAKHQR